jgi:hypothetical protein
MIVQPFDLFAQPVSVEGFHDVHNTSVERPSPLLSKTAVGHLIGQRMLEGVSEFGHHPCLVEQFHGLEMHQAEPQDLLRHLANGPRYGIRIRRPWDIDLGEGQGSVWDRTLLLGPTIRALVRTLCAGLRWGDHEAECKRPYNTRVAQRGANVSSHPVHGASYLWFPTDQLSPSAQGPRVTADSRRASSRPRSYPRSTS